MPTGGAPPCNLSTIRGLGSGALANGASFVGVGGTGRMGSTSTFRVNPRGARPETARHAHRRNVGLLRRHAGKAANNPVALQAAQARIDSGAGTSALPAGGSKTAR